MKALILLATLKKDKPSNTETLSRFLMDRMKEKGVDTELVKLVNHRILPGTKSDMGDGDEWPSILEKIFVADILIFATPVWWGSHSSEMQRVIERLDELHDEILQGKTSRLYRKIGGIVVTGDSDGAEHIIGNIANFFNAIGILFPPYATLTVLDKKQEKGSVATQEDLLQMYKKEYTKTADTMIGEFKKSLG